MGVDGAPAVMAGGGCWARGGGASVTVSPLASGSSGGGWICASVGAVPRLVALGGALGGPWAGITPGAAGIGIGIGGGVGVRALVPGPWAADGGPEAAAGSAGTRGADRGRAGGGWAGGGSSGRGPTTDGSRIRWVSASA